jgi:anaerobic dimethyl sulfoxide reductase subunit C (anchor subunit)
MPAGLRSLWLIVTMVLGVVFVWMMVRVYNTIDTVPTWYSVWTPLSFFLTMFIGGPLLGYLLLRVAGVDGWAMRLLPVVLLALVVSAMVALMQGVNWHHSQLYSAGLCAGAGLRFADGLARGAAGRWRWYAGLRAQRLSAGAAAAVLAFVLVLAGDDWPRRVLRPAYDRWYGYRQLTLYLLYQAGHSARLFFFRS